MRRAAGYLVVAVLAFLVALWFARSYGGLGFAAPTQAQKNVLAILDRPPAAVQIPDSAMVTASARIEPAVVNIDTLMTRQTRAFDFFGNPQQRSYVLQGKGSGVLISADGYIVTNNHVIDGASVIKVTLPDNRQFDGHLIGADSDADLAVVKIDGSGFPFAELGDSAKLKVGEYVIAIGYPLGIGTTVTHGIISATDRKDLEISEGRTLKHAIQTDAPINRGNSGGALANLDGQLVGINTAIASENQGGSIGIGFAIPIDAARPILRRLIAEGKPQQPVGAGAPFMGIEYTPLDPQQAADLNIPPGNGVVIRTVVPLTPAASAGLNPGDVIISVDGRPVTGANDLRGYISRRRVGDQLLLGVVRTDGSRDQVKLTLGRKPQGVS